MKTTDKNVCRGLVITSLLAELGFVSSDPARVIGVVAFKKKNNKLMIFNKIIGNQKH
jgi:hypothetical protein